MLKDFKFVKALICLFAALSGSDGHSAKVEDWTSMTSMSSRSFPSGVNGVDKINEPDLKYPQQVHKINIKSYKIAGSLY